MPEYEVDRCSVCNKPLCHNKTIFAALGKLYCSEKCGRKEIKHFSVFAEELTPSSIGIVPPVKYKVTGVTKFGMRIKPRYTNFPAYYSRDVFIGTVWRVLPDGKLEKEYNIVNCNRR